MMYGMTTNCHVNGGVAREVEIAKEPGKKTLFFNLALSVPVESKRTFHSSNLLVVFRYDVSTN